MILSPDQNASKLGAAGSRMSPSMLAGLSIQVKIKPEIGNTSGTCGAPGPDTRRRRALPTRNRSCHIRSYILLPAKAFAEFRDSFFPPVGIVFRPHSLDRLGGQLPAKAGYGEAKGRK